MAMNPKLAAQPQPRVHSPRRLAVLQARPIRSVMTRPKPPQAAPNPKWKTKPATTRLAAKAVGWALPTTQTRGLENQVTKQKPSLARAMVFVCAILNSDAYFEPSM